MNYARRVRHECLDLYIFEALVGVQETATERLGTGNHDCPTMSIGGMTPAQKLKLSA